MSLTTEVYVELKLSYKRLPPEIQVHRHKWVRRVLAAAGYAAGMV